MADKSLKQVRQYLQGLVAHITGAPTYEFVRLITDQETLAAQMGARNEAGDWTYHGWQITREASGALPDTADPRIDYTFERSYVMILEGWMSFNDDIQSELVFQDIVVEGILDALDADPNLGTNCDRSDPPQLRRLDARFYGTVLCHHAEIALTIYQRRDRI